MNANSDPLYEKYKDLDFADGKSVAETPALAQLQAERGGKTRITMRVDNETLAAFKLRAAQSGSNYQTMMNDVLKQFIQGESLVDVIKQTIRQELRHG
ncbi:MAG: BrnA antitoxin family protein [Thiolinea sp.]